MGFFLWLSDLHVDPYYGRDHAVGHRNGDTCTLNETLTEHPRGRIGCDAPVSLLESSLESAKRGVRIDFVLVTGDFVRHGMESLASVLGADGDDDDPIDLAESIMAACIGSIGSVLPGVPIIPVLGNNDVVPDYYLETNDEHGSDNEYSYDGNATAGGTNKMLAMARNGLADSFLSEEEGRTFAHGGYFSRTIDISGSSSILVLSLNTVIYSVKHQPDYEASIGGGDDDDDPLGQFRWMESQLTRATESVLLPMNTGDTDSVGGSVANATDGDEKTNNDDDDDDRRIAAIYLVGHIPPSIGSYRHSQLWHDRYVDRYASVLKNYYRGNLHSADGGNRNNNETSAPPPPIRGNLFGHVHTEEFRLVSYSYDEDWVSKASDLSNTDASDDGSERPGALVVPMLVTSSITPIYGSNPSYRIVEYDDDSGSLLDYTTHYLDLNTNRIDPQQQQQQQQQQQATGGSTTTNTVAGESADDWIALPGFAQAYGVPDLSSSSFERILERFRDELDRLEDDDNDQGAPNSNTKYWDTFLQRQNVYSSAFDDGDDKDFGRRETMVDWMCTLTASLRNEYDGCLAAGLSSNATTTTTATDAQNTEGMVLYLIACNTLAVVGVLAAFFVSARRKKRAKRGGNIYHRSSLGEGEEPPSDGLVVVGNGSHPNGRRGAPPMPPPSGAIELTNLGGGGEGRPSVGELA